MSPQVNPIPNGYGTVTPHIVVQGADKAVEFYKNAFGAVERGKDYYPDGKSVMHAEILIGNSIVMITDAMPQMKRWVSPSTLSGTTVALHLYTEDVDTVFDRAVAAGAKPSMPIMDTFWGDRYGRVTDPFGHEWSLATRTQNLTPAEIKKGAREFFAQMAKAPVG